jgi:hypothetical protein
MRPFILCLLVIGLAACPSDNNKPAIDAPAGHVDAPKNVDSSMAGDAPGADAAKMVCTGAIYDACNPAASNCMTGTTCKTFNGSGFSVCTPTCTTTCPMQGTMTVTCNGMGLCKPNAPNTTCTAP